MNGQKGFREIYGCRIVKKNKWTWERIHKLGRRSYHGFPVDGGVRMECERLAAKVTKGISLIENDIRYLERLEKTE